MRFGPLLGAFCINHHHQRNCLLLSSTQCSSGLYLIAVGSNLVTAGTLSKKMGRPSPWTGFLPSQPRYPRLRTRFPSVVREEGAEIVCPAVGLSRCSLGTGFPFQWLIRTWWIFSIVQLSLLGSPWLSAWQPKKTKQNKTKNPSIYPRNRCVGSGSASSSVSELTASGGRDVRFTARPAFLPPQLWKATSACFLLTPQPKTTT